MGAKKTLSSAIAIYQAVAFLLIGLPSLTRRCPTSVGQIIDNLHAGEAQAWQTFGLRDHDAVQAIQMAGSVYISGLLLVPGGRILGLPLAVLAFLWGAWVLHCEGGSAWVGLGQAGLAGLALAWDGA